MKARYPFRNVHARRCQYAPQLFRGARFILWRSQKLSPVKVTFSRPFLGIAAPVKAGAFGCRALEIQLGHIAADGRGIHLGSGRLAVWGMGLRVEG